MRKKVNENINKTNNLKNSSFPWRPRIFFLGFSFWSVRCMRRASELLPAVFLCAAVQQVRPGRPVGRQSHMLGSW